MFEHYEKHMFDPSPHDPHTKIISYVGKNKKVLDVGCSSGYIAKELNKKGCNVFGIEIDITSAEIAKKYCEKVLVGDVEEINELPFSDKYFDVIIFSDILEHLKKPDNTLQRLRRYLKSEGIIIASIPNVARFEVRFGLLLGKFRYQESGILSKSHLRFFTLETIKSLFTISGYKIVKLDYTGLGSRIKILPTLFAFQFLIVATPIQ